MTGSRHPKIVERAASSVEYVGLAIAVSLLLVAVGGGAAGAGGSVGEAVAERLGQVVDAASSGGRRREARERRWEGGDQPQRVPRDVLRLAPAIDPIAAWHRHWVRGTRVAGIDGRIETRACAFCVALEWSHEHGSGAQLDTSGAHVGLQASVSGAARLALASVDAAIRARRTIGPVRLTSQARARATIGAEADAELRARISRREQDLQVGGTAMVGAAARAEGRIGVELLGVALEQAARAEAWAGAGARGMVGVHRTPDRISWRFGWGAALGLGGASEWSGSVDVSGVPQRHRRIARASIATALRAALMPLPALIPFAEPIPMTRHGGAHADDR